MPISPAEGRIYRQEAEVGYPFCERALAFDPNNARALVSTALRFWLPAVLGLSADPSGDLKRGDELLSHALAVDPKYPNAHQCRAVILRMQGHTDQGSRRTSARWP